MRKHEIPFENVNKEIVVKILLLEEDSNGKYNNNTSIHSNTNDIFLNESTKENYFNLSQEKIDQEEILEQSEKRNSNLKFESKLTKIKENSNHNKINSIKIINFNKKNFNSQNKSLSTITETSDFQKNEIEFRLGFQKEIFERDNEFFTVENLNLNFRMNEETKPIESDNVQNYNENILFFC